MQPQASHLLWARFVVFETKGLDLISEVTVSSEIAWLYFFLLPISLWDVSHIRSILKKFTVNPSSAPRFCVPVSRAHCIPEPACVPIPSEGAPEMKGDVDQGRICPIVPDRTCERPSIGGSLCRSPGGQVFLLEKRTLGGAVLPARGQVAGGVGGGRREEAEDRNGRGFCPCSPASIS